MEVLSGGLSPANSGIESTCDFAGIHFDCPLGSEDGNLVIRPAGQWIVGSIMGSKSMANILNSHLFRKYGACDGDTNVEKASFSDDEEPMCCDFMNSPNVLSNYSSNTLYKETAILGKQRYKSETLHERPVSMSSTNSTCSEQASSSLSPTASQGMLQYSWEDGNPHFVFSLDDQKLVYVANLWKVGPVDEKDGDYTYLFYLRMAGQRDREIHDDDYLVGKMKVSTSFSLCPYNSKIMEREFVLFGGNETLVNIQTSSQDIDIRKDKGLSKKVTEVFRASHSMKKKTISRLTGSSAVLESWSLEPHQNIDNSNNAYSDVNLLENNLPPNLELVAIVVKDHIPENREQKGGGWGLNFLTKSSEKQTTGLMESSQTCGCCAQKTADCSTSMDILIPASLHGGPRTRNGGPSSLTQRWRSGGCCDCGGWDQGCPLTVLESRISNKEQGGCKLIDLITQGSENSVPPLRMVNVYDGLYFVNFQSSLSALQSFSVAVAFIHSQNPTFRPEMYRS